MGINIGYLLMPEHRIYFWCRFHKEYGNRIAVVYPGFRGWGGVPGAMGRGYFFTLKK